MPEHKLHEQNEEEFSFTKFFTQLTSSKAFHIIMLVGIIVFFNSLFNSFVFDDNSQIVNNPAIHSLAYILVFFAGGTFFDPASNQIIGMFYRPVVSIIYSLIFAISGPQPFLFHLFQLLLHSLNAFLVFILFRKFFKATISLFFAIIFLIHPINQEAVAYISDLQENLFFFFGILALIVSSKRVLNLRRLILINILFFFGLLSKETAILFLPILFLYRYSFQRNFFSKTLLSLLFTTGIYLYLRFQVAHLSKIADALTPIAQASLEERLTTMPAIILYYLKTFFFPSQLTIQQMWVVKELSFNQFYLPLILLLLFFAGIITFAVFLWKQNRKIFTTYFFFLIWFLLGIVMHLQITPLDATVANRWFYFPIIGLLGLLAVVFSFIKSRFIIKNSIIIIVAFIIVGILAGRTIVRNTNWFNMLTLCQHDLKIAPNYDSVQFICGIELLKVGQYQKAKEHFAIAAQLKPDWGLNWYHYGQAYERTKDIKKAKDFYQRSIQLSNNSDAFISLAGTYLKYDNNPKQAKKVLEEGLKSYPNNQRLQLFLAVCEYKLNNKERAIEIAQKAYQTLPSKQAQYVLNQILADQEVTLE